MAEPRGPVAVAIRRPVGVVVGILFVLMFGALTLQSLPIQLAPDVQVPSLSVSTAWPGATPDEVERQVIVPQEEVLKTVSGIERMTATASASRASIDLEFRVGTDLSDALVRVSNQLAQVADYPDNVEEPAIETASSSGPALAVILLQAKDGGPVGRFRTWGEEEIVSRLQRVPGVAAVDYFGGRDRTVEVTFDPADLAARGVGVADLSRALQGQLRDLSAGDMTLGKRRYQVRTMVTPTEPEDLDDLVLRVTADGRTVRLGDVARARFGLAKPTAHVINNGVESIAMLLRREAGTNVLAVTEEVRSVVRELQETRLDPEGLQIAIVGDQTGYITEALVLIRNNLLMGGALAVVVLLVFLRSARASAVIATAIPICVLGTALGMAVLGRTVNVISVAGMAFAVGMVVDNAIVVLENIDTWHKRLGQQAARAAEAAFGGTVEVWGAILASTLTTAAVFIPIITWEDEVGELLRDVAVAISLSVSISLVVSVLVIPSMAARLLSGRRVVASSGPSVAIARAERLRAGITSVVRWLVSRRRRAAATVLLTTLAAGSVIAALLPPMEYLPTGNRNFFFGFLIPPPGYSLEEMTAIGEEIQADLVPNVGADPAREARTGVPAIDRAFFVARSERGILGGSAIDADRIDDLVAFARGRVARVPGVIGVVNQASLFGRGIGSSRSIEIDVSGGDIAQLVAVGGKLMGAVNAALPGSQVRPVPSLDLGAPELRVLPRRERAAALGISPTDIGVAVDALVDGRKVGEIGLVGEPRLDVILQARWGDRAGDSIISAPAVGAKTPTELAAAPVAAPGGAVVPVSAVADVTEAIAPTVIQRIERRRAITLDITPPEGVPLEAAIAKVRGEVLPSVDSPGEVRFDISGSAGKLEEAQRHMAGVLALAVIISYLLLAALFEDFVAPLVILVVVPFAAAGGVAGVRLADALLAPQGFDMMTALGFVILIGVVVNNAILVVDGALARLRDGVPLDEAAADAVRGRIRPIFMSTFTTVAGLLPLVLFPGSGAEMYRGVGSVVLGGMLVATFLTVFVVPSLFSLVWRLRCGVTA